MGVLVVYESMYGNTRAIAEAVAEGVGGDAEVRSVHDAGSVAGFELLIVGGPTHMHGLSSSMTRRMAAEASEEDGHAAVQPSATEGPGLRAWLRDLPGGTPAAAFDTRLDRSPLMTGSAARGIGRRLRHRGYEVIGSESFLVDDAEGPLAEGESDRATAWGLALAQLMESSRSAI